MKTNCPDCNSLQRFTPRERQGNAGTIETYIACGACGYEQILWAETPAQQLARRRDRVQQLRALRRHARR